MKNAGLKVLLTVLALPVGADWDPEAGHDDDEWEERPDHRDSGGAGKLS